MADIDNPSTDSIELRRFDLHSLWRVLLWGASAAMALAVVAGTAFSDLGADRLKQVVASFIEPAKPSQQDLTANQIAELEKQTRSLSQTVRDLTAERDQVKGRLAILEQNLDDITGAIKRQTAVRAPDKPQEPAKPVAQTPPPELSAPATVAAVESPTAVTPAPDTAVTTTASTTETATITGPVPMPPQRLASVASPAAAKMEGEPPATTRQLGVDLGGASSVDALRTHWAALKANVRPELVGLRPSFMTRQKQSGGADYRLVLGPMPSGTAALRLCAKLAASRVSCRAGTFTVQQLAEP